MFAQQATESKSSETLSNTLLGITWTLFGIATISFGARLYLRWKRFGRLFWDDLFVFLAWVFCVLLGVQVVLSLRSADQKTTTANKHDSLFISRPIVQLCFYSSVWSIKVSFLLFFRRLIGVVLRRVRIYWNCVFIFVLASFLLTWAFNPYHCWATKGIIACNGDPLGEKLVLITFPLAAMLDILTDLLIMAIPYMILRHVRLSTKQKLVLYSLFSLVIITIGVALTRVIVSMKARRQGGLTVSLLVFLADAEAATALFVACIGSFRTLFTQADTLTPYGSRNNQTPKAKPQNLGKQRSTGYSSNRNESSEAIVNATELRDMPPQSPQTPSAFYMKLELPGLGKT